MDIQTAINNVINHIDLNREDMHSVMQTIMQGNATSAQIGGLLVALRIKGETVDEITAAASLSLIKGKVNIAAIIAVKIPPIKIDNIGSKATFSKIG